MSCIWCSGKAKYYFTRSISTVFSVSYIMCFTADEVVEPSWLVPLCLSFTCVTVETYTWTSVSLEFILDVSTKQSIFNFKSTVHRQINGFLIIHSQWSVSQLLQYQTFNISPPIFKALNRYPQNAAPRTLNLLDSDLSEGFAETEVMGRISFSCLVWIYR